MLPVERQNKILELLSTKNILKIPEIVSEFNISVETVRRDINTLERHGKIEKVYGGIKLISTNFGEPKIENRMIDKIHIKDKIGCKCSEFINDGDCIFIDSGSTTYQIAKHIKNKKNIIVVTNSLPVITELIGSDIELIIIGGKIRNTENSVVAYDYLFNFDQLNISKAFIGTSGITAKKGISDYNMEEALTRKKIIEISNKIYVAADSSKFGKDVTINICPINKINYIITDYLIDKEIINKFESKNCQIISTETL